MYCAKAQFYFLFAVVDYNWINQVNPNMRKFTFKVLEGIKNALCKPQCNFLFAVVDYIWINEVNPILESSLSRFWREYKNALRFCAMLFSICSCGLQLDQQR